MDQFLRIQRGRYNNPAPEAPQISVPIGGIYEQQANGAYPTTPTYELPQESQPGFEEPTMPAEPERQYDAAAYEIYTAIEAPRAMNDARIGLEADGPAVLEDTFIDSEPLNPMEGEWVDAVAQFPSEEPDSIDSVIEG